MNVGNKKGAEVDCVVKLVIYNKWGCPSGIILDKCDLS